MSSIKPKVMEFAKKSPRYTVQEYREIHTSDIMALNKAIEPKIRQNGMERIASAKAAAQCIIGKK